MEQEKVINLDNWGDLSELEWMKKIKELEPGTRISFFGEEGIYQRHQKQGNQYQYVPSIEFTKKGRNLVGFIGKDIFSVYDLGPNDELNTYEKAK